MQMKRNIVGAGPMENQNHHSVEGLSSFIGVRLCWMQHHAVKDFWKNIRTCCGRTAFMPQSIQLCMFITMIRPPSFRYGTKKVL